MKIIRRPGGERVEREKFSEKWKRSFVKVKTAVWRRKSSPKGSSSRKKIEIAF